MAMRFSVRRNSLLLSLAITIAAPSAVSVAWADDATPAPPAPSAESAPAAPATPAPAPAAPAEPAATPAPAPVQATPAPAPVQATPAPTPVQAAPAPEPVQATPAAAPAAESQPATEASDNRAKESKKERLQRERKPIQKKANFEQMERHKGEGYYSVIEGAKEEKIKKYNFEQMERHQDDGYYTRIPSTPKVEDYPVTPTPAYTPPPQPVQPAAVIPPAVDDPNRKKFDDDPGAVGSITFTRHMKSANDMMSSGHFEQAKRHFKEAQHLRPDDPTVYPGLIQASQEAKDWSELQRATKKFIELDASKNNEYAWVLGDAYFHLSKYDQAQPLLKKALTYGHHQEQIHNILLKMAQQTHNTADMLVEYSALVKYKGTDPKMRLEYAALLETSSKYPEAIAQYKAAVAANPADGNTMGRLAYLLMYHNKDYDGAINYYRKAMAADPANFKTYEDGIVYCNQQKKIAAGPKKKSE